FQGASKATATTTAQAIAARKGRRIRRHSQPTIAHATRKNVCRAIGVVDELVLVMRPVPGSASPFGGGPLPEAVVSPRRSPPGRVRLHEVPVHAGDELETDALRAHGLALAVVRAVPEP